MKHDDQLIRFYTEFVSYAVLSSIFNYVGPVVNVLCYRGEKGGQGLRHRAHTVDPINQLFFTVIKLKLNLKLKHLVFLHKNFAKSNIAVH